MKGVILAGGKGTRISPLTLVTSKQLLPVFDKPLIYYPICTLMELQVREILIITTREHHETFRKVLGDGSQFGISLSYKIQESPDGLAQGVTLSKNFIGHENFYFILGDNLFHGNDFLNLEFLNDGATIFTKQVKDPENYGVVQFDTQGSVINLIEKPVSYVSSDAIVGLYRYDETAFERVKKITKSSRGELEITELNKSYLVDSKLQIVKLTNGTTWFDTGGFEQLHDAGGFVRGVQERIGSRIGDPFLQAQRNGWV